MNNIRGMWTAALCGLDLSFGQVGSLVICGVCCTRLPRLVATSCVDSSGLIK
jgi:hypothetical protein